MKILSWFSELMPDRSRSARRRRNGLKEAVISQVELLEQRSMLSASSIAVKTIEPINGSGNNVANPNWGSAGSDLLRVSPVAYADGISSPSQPNNISPRVISDNLNNQMATNNSTADVQTVDQNSLSDFGYAWGQFLDHDMSLTQSDPTKLLSIQADPNDPSQMGNQTFQRSVTDPSTGSSTKNPAQQVNSVTSYLDLSQVYGSSTAIADALRSHQGGLMKTSPGNMLPYDNSTYFTPDQLAIIHMQNDSGAVPTSNLFVTGDVRGNENVELTALQTLFMRNHNKIASELQAVHPSWTDEQLYQEARKLNIAEYQQITYNEYLPDLLGGKAMSPYSGYKPNVSTEVATEFSTVGFRFGHSLLSSEIGRAGNDGQQVLPNDPAGATISLSTDFFDPNVLNPQGVVDPLTGHISTDIGPILKADADGVSQATDLLVVSDVRNLLFANGGIPDNGQDLVARDIERTRDHGIGSYNQVRVAYGLPAVTDFSQITSDVATQNKLKATYGSVDKIDPFEGGLAEDHVRGSDMGPLFTKILSEQFTRTRDGDRFFYMNQTFNTEEQGILKQGNTLTKAIEANTNITNMQADAFRFEASISGNVTLAPPTIPSGQNVALSDSMSTDSLTSGSTSPGRQILGHPPTPPGVGGIIVELKNSSGDVVATTITDRMGHYSFNQLSGVAANPTADSSGVSSVGNYTVDLKLPSGFTQTSSNPEAVNVTKGGTKIQNMNFQVISNAPPASHNKPHRIQTNGLKNLSNNFDHNITFE